MHVHTTRTDSSDRRGRSCRRGVIPGSKAVLTASNAGVPVILDKESDAGQAYSDAVARYLGEDLPHRFLEIKKKGFFSRMLGG